MYDFENFVKAWARSAFGVFIAFAFWWAFDSFFLGFMALAFFFFVPISNVKAENAVNRIIFGALMILLLFWAFGFGFSDTLGLGLSTGAGGFGTGGGILFALFVVAAGFYSFGSGRAKTIGGIAALVFFFAAVFVSQPWNWNTSALIFMGVWLMSLIVGMASDPQTKAAVGVFIIAVSFIIYTGGTGTQEVGTAFFGQWWPTVHNYWSQISEPIYNAIQPLWGTIGSAWQLMTNPVGYATQLMNGSYATNPLGQTGVHGVDITDFTVTPAYVNQPFVISATFKNNGASKATDVRAKLEIDTSKLHVYSGSTDTKGLTDIKDIGVNDNDQRVGDGTMEKIGMAQNIFTSNSGITCDMVNKYSSTNGVNLRSKVIPLKLATTYNYQSDSHVSIEFISQSEWNRLSNENKLQLKDVQSQYSSAPVKFPIGTAGLKQPILAGFQQFNIGLRLDAEAMNSKVVRVMKVELYYPADFALKGKCTPEGNPGDAGNGKKKVVWNNLQGEGTKIMFCNFDFLGNDKMGSAATKTYEITAHADYQFSNWRTAEMKLEFGGVCCSYKDCLDGQVCHDCTCMPKSTSTETGCPATGAAASTTTTPASGGGSTTPASAGGSTTPAPSGGSTEPAGGGSP